MKESVKPWVTVVQASGDNARRAARLSRLRLFFRQPGHWIFIVVAAIIGFPGLYPSVFLFYGSLTDAPLGASSRLTLTNYIQAYPIAPMHSAGRAGEEVFPVDGVGCMP